ncbi:hypothetical protein SKAU_G00024200 [Synaphobranchus kaupii]|uniref:Uncharacterized protein n=1 Tax=Synaphobranchus kaupii TaxID=118154 RepID=A0A9Q1JER9_SYNKA|nr:hypothetical protein SKAU_G00024200 [Synaphobranchus kaupii]
MLPPNSIHKFQHFTTFCSVCENTQEFSGPPPDRERECRAARPPPRGPLSQGAPRVLQRQGSPHQALAHRARSSQPTDPNLLFYQKPQEFAGEFTLALTLCSKKHEHMESFGQLTLTDAPPPGTGAKTSMR